MHPACVKAATRILAMLQELGNLVLLAARLWMAKIFWQSGMVKIEDWGNTLYLFKEEYHVPLLPPSLAALFATSFELACPVLLVLGLGARLATLPMLAMVAVIQFTYDSNMEHFYWAMLLATLLCFGPGKLSLAHFIRAKLLKYKS
ncbi:MAG: DoxX family protein [Proteobacteria bacterium]|nr:DoxX family protein [Pseudomonadota bacterium]